MVLLSNKILKIEEEGAGFVTAEQYNNKPTNQTSDSGRK